MTDNNLVKKMLAAQKELKAAPETGFNAFQKYSYATANDVLTPVREVCNKHGLLIMCSIEEANIETKQAWVKAVLSIIDIETNDSIKVSAFGYSDRGDKAIYIAITGATKYAVRSAFLLPSDDDPENEKGQSQQQSYSKPSTSSSAQNKPDKLKPGGISDKQVKRLWKIARSEGGKSDDEVKSILNDFGYESTSDINWQDYEEICKRLATPF